MRELLRGDGSNPTVLAQAIVAVQGEKPTIDAADNDSELVSVRRLSRIAQHEEVITLLLSLAEPMPPPQQDEEATFGVNPRDFQPPPQP
jgi:hypothetical protein